jgi:hypothetical protein
MGDEVSRYEVSIEGGRAPPVTLVVTAVGWVEAWQQGLVAIGLGEFPEDAVCAVTEERVHIRVPSLDAVFVVQRLPNASALDSARAVDNGRPSNRKVTPVGRLEAIAGPERARPARLVAPGPAPSVRLDPVIAATAPERPAAITGRELRPDPLDELLALLDRQRKLARPVELATDTGLPRPREAPQSPFAALRRGHGTVTRPDLSDPLGRADLPQQFHPIAFEDVAPELESVFDWAVQTARQHIPCDLALWVVSEGEQTAVIATAGATGWARGAIATSPAWLAAAQRAPHRARFPTAQSLGVIDSAGAAHHLEVAAILGTPLEAPSGHALVLLNPPRPSGFTDAEVRALRYFALTVGERLATEP